MLPLTGIRILDLTMFWAGPVAANLLGNLGAEVIKIEAIQRLDGFRGFAAVGEKWWERPAPILVESSNKLGITLDLTNPMGREAFLKLAKISDVVMDNFPSRVMRNFGLTYPVLQEVNPTIVQLAMPGYGTTGPWRDFAAFALNIEQAAGVAYASGYEDEGPMAMRVSDPIQGYAGAFAILVALDYRRRTGKGQFIDQSQCEALAVCSGPAVLEYSMNRRSPSQHGNRHPSMAPHGAYRCQGEDNWIVMAIATDKEWARFCGVVGHGAWAKDLRFSTLASRLRNQDKLDKLVESWTAKQDRYEAMELLQRAGIPAGVLEDEADIHKDPHLNARDFFQSVTRKVTGTHHLPKIAFRLSKSPMGYRMPAPLFGEHNEYILGEVLALPKRRLKEMEEAKVIGKVPLGAE